MSLLAEELKMLRESKDPEDAEKLNILIRFVETYGESCWQEYLTGTKFDYDGEY